MTILNERLWNSKKAVFFTNNKKREINNIEKIVSEMEALIPHLKKEIEVLRKLHLKDGL